MASLSTLPDELVAAVAWHLSAVDIAALHAVCRSLRAATDGVDAWSRALRDCGVTDDAIEAMRRDGEVYASFGERLGVNSTWLYGDVTASRVPDIHRSGIRQFRLSDDERVCFTTSDDTTVLEWVLETGEQLTRYSYKSQYAYDVAFTDDLVVVSGFSSTVKLFRRGEGDQALQTKDFELRAEGVYRIEWLDKPSRLCTLCYNGSMQLIDVETFECANRIGLASERLWDAKWHEGLGGYFVCGTEHTHFVDPRTSKFEKVIKAGAYHMSIPLDRTLVVAHQGVAVYDTRKLANPRCVCSGLDGLSWGCSADEQKIVLSAWDQGVEIVEANFATDELTHRVHLEGFGCSLYLNQPYGGNKLAIGPFREYFIKLEFQSPTREQIAERKQLGVRRVAVFKS